MSEYICEYCGNEYTGFEASRRGLCCCGEQLTPATGRWLQAERGGRGMNNPYDGCCNATQTGTPIFSGNIEDFAITIHGKRFDDVPSLDWLADAVKEKLARERGWGCAYCVIGKRSPDAEYCSNCGRKLTPTLPELANESEEVNHD